MTKSYTIKGQRTPADVVADRVEIIETGYTLAEARVASIELQKTGEFCCVWIEEQPAKPRITRRIERDHRGNKFNATYLDGWAI